MDKKALRKAQGMTQKLEISKQNVLEILFF